jgi:opacity protein-like surface antigen
MRLAEVERQSESEAFMSKPILIAFATCALLATASPPALAQEGAAAAQPLVEISGGYSFMRDFTIEENFPAGWYFSTALNPLDWFGLVGEVTGAYKTLDENLLLKVKTHGYTFMGGPRFFRRFGQITPYGQLLVGGVHGRVEATPLRDMGFPSVTESSTEFAFQPGGGISVYLNDHVGVRLSMDYRRIVFDNEEEDNSEFRVLTGIVIGFGSR